VDLRDNDLLRNVETYSIINRDDSDDIMMVKNVFTERFQLPTDPESPSFRRGVGYPTYLILETTPHSFWERYTLTLDGVVDEYDAEMCSSGVSFDYRGKSTKVDEGLSDSELFALMGEDSLSLSIMTAMFMSDEVIGGSFMPDDWEE
jgi:hypothetical protein